MRNYHFATDEELQDEEEADFAIWWAGIEKQNQRADDGEYDDE